MTVMYKRRGAFALTRKTAGCQRSEVPWGPDGSLELHCRWRAHSPGQTSTSSGRTLTGPIGDYPAALEQALDNPVGATARGAGCTRLDGRDRGRRPVAMDAGPRGVADRPGAAARGGSPAEDVTISVGVGRHHAVEPEAMRRRVGDAIAAGYRCFSPPVDDLSAYADLGQTPQGMPVRVFRPVAEADLRILVGSVLPHLQAGFGGGYKLIFPGTSHRSTLGALHRQGLGGRSDAAGLLGGDAAENPMRQAIHAAAERLGPCWSISHLVGGPGQVFRVVAGHPERVQDLLAAEARRRLPGTPTRRRRT